MHTSGCLISVNESGDCNNKQRTNGYNNGIMAPNYSTSSSTSLDVVRHYVNPAVYIESKLDIDTVPFEKSPPFECFIAETPRPPRIVKVKRCVCLTNAYNCPIHENVEDKHAILKPNQEDVTKLSVILNDTARSETDSGIRRSGSMMEDDLRLSISSLTSINTYQDSKIDVNEPIECRKSTNRYASTKTSDTESDAVKEQRYREWCARKDTEKRLLEHKECLIKQIKEKQRDMQREKERESFRNWLAIKKCNEQEERKRQIDSEMNKKRLEELKEKRLEESKLTYQVWLRRKEEKLLEKKIKEQFLLLKDAEEKQTRGDYNRKAYDLWLIESKNKPKPIRLNQGLQTLRSSSSLSFINPKPWVPNVDIKPKPASQ